jgi:hypothetical protein
MKSRYDYKWFFLLHLQANAILIKRSSMATRPRSTGRKHSVSQHRRGCVTKNTVEGVRRGLVRPAPLHLRSYVWNSEERTVQTQNSVRRYVQDTVPWVTTPFMTNANIIQLKQMEVDGAFTLRGCNQKFQDWPPGARTTNGTALCH